MSGNACWIRPSERMTSGCSLLDPWFIPRGRARSMVLSCGLTLIRLSFSVTCWVVFSKCLVSRRRPSCSSGSPILVSFLWFPWIASRVQGSIFRPEGRRPKLCDCQSHPLDRSSRRRYLSYGRLFEGYPCPRGLRPSRFFTWLGPKGHLPDRPSFRRA